MERRERSIFRLGHSLAVYLPAAWVRDRGLIAGDKIRVRIGRDLVLIPRPRSAVEGRNPDGAGGGCPKGGDAEDGGDDDPRP